MLVGSLFFPKSLLEQPSKGTLMSQTNTPKHVLICEDEGLTVMALRRTLVRAGYVVIGEEGDGERAVALAKQLQPDLILMDVGLTGSLSGIEAARQILQEQTVPIIALTAYSDDTHYTAALEAGVCGYLVKPFTSEQLIPAIEAALARYESVQTALQAVNAPSLLAPQSCCPFSPCASILLPLISFGNKKPVLGYYPFERTEPGVIP
jgi:AmiR/NasT family two-component response regulator